MVERARGIYALGEQLARLQSSGRPYVEFLREASLSAGVYRLAAGEPDRQRPHTQDELYYVIDGEGVVEIAGERTAVHPGDAIFVAKGVEHRFYDYPSGLTLLVIFAPPEAESPA